MQQILAQLTQSRRRVRQRGAGALLLGRDLFLRHAMPFERGARIGLGGTQRRQRGGRLRCLGHGLGRGLGGGGHRHASRMQCRFRLRPDSAGAGALDRQKFRLRLADRTRDVAVAAGLSRLALQRAKLAFKLPAQIVGPRQVGLGGA